MRLYWYEDTSGSKPVEQTAARQAKDCSKTARPPRIQGMKMTNQSGESQVHLLNQMRLGRSIDSPKRRNGFVFPRDGDADPDGFLDSLADSTEGASLVEAVMAHDFMSALLQHLGPIERKVLACLADGLGTLKKRKARSTNPTVPCRLKGAGLEHNKPQA